ncbi:GGDEF domain-containing protein [Granulosicoccus sp. 3-233]|uniref:GGDEF domain-containing protein n=1 Tax=Granulosicoccus sp. 3-233 TaxID=3417969 RepID=UPI003D347BDA
MLSSAIQKLSFSLEELSERGPDRLTTMAGLCGFCIHVGFCGLFVLLNLWSLVTLNVVSCGLWIYVIWLASTARPGMAVHLATFEVLSHAIVATSILGPSFGFHFYLWPVTILIALNPSLKFRHSALISMLTMLLFGCLSAFVSSDRSADYTPQLVNGIFFLNILVSGFSMILTGMLVRHMFSLQSRELREHARTDELTRLYNRRHVLEFLKSTEAHRQRNRIPYCVCLCDLDHFKSINDSHGHDTGDAILVSFAEFLQRSLRETDCVARWGGEEFMIVLTNTAGNNAFDTMTSLLTRLRSESRIAISDRQQLSMSIGVAEAMDGASIDEVVVRADQALYRAKAEGRDRVVLHHADTPPAKSPATRRNSPSR